MTFWSNRKTALANAGVSTGASGGSNTSTRSTPTSCAHMTAPSGRGASCRGQARSTTPEWTCVRSWTSTGTSARADWPKGLSDLPDGKAVLWIPRHISSRMAAQEAAFLIGGFRDHP